MRVVMISFLCTLSILLMMSGVSAETIVFDYATASTSTGVTNNGNGNYVWTVPAGVTSITVEAWGAGGNGGTGGAYGVGGYCGPGGGGGGGSGGYAQATIQIPAGVTKYYILVGRNNTNTYLGTDAGYVISLGPGGRGRNGMEYACAGGSEKTGYTDQAPGGVGGMILNATALRSWNLGTVGSVGGRGGYANSQSGYGFPGAGGNGASAPQGGVGGLGGRDPSGDQSYSGGGHAGGGGELPGAGGGGGDGYSGAGGGGGKGRVIIEYTAVIVPPSVVPVVGSCPLNQTIFRLYQEGNSHVANASQTEATVPICYPAIFGSEYTGANPHQCTGANIVLKATSDKNAHAASPTHSSPTYATSYCYGDLSCAFRTTCLGTEQLVARAPAGTNNLHIGNASFSAYTQLLCCSSGPQSIFNSPQWTTPTGTPITSAYVNQTVNVSVSTSLPAGTPVTFTFQEEDGLIGDDDLAEVSGTVQNGRVSVSLKLNDTLLSKGKDGDGVATELEFTVAASGGGSISPSTSIMVSLIHGGQGYLLEGNITGAYHGQVYVNGTQLIINHTFSRQKALRVNWTIEEDTLRSSEDAFVYNLTTSGQKTLTLQVSNNDGGHAELQIGFLVIPSNNSREMMAFIDYPGYYQIVKTGREPATQVVFQANTSFAITRTLTDCGNLRCLGGACPQKTNNTDPLCGNVVRTIMSSPGYSSLAFFWEIMQQGTWQPIGGFVGGGFTTTTTLGNSMYSDRLHDRQIRVNVTYTTTPLMSTQFTRSFTLGQCLNNGHQFAIMNTHGQFVRLVATVQGEGTSAIPFSKDACKGEDERKDTSDDCVPNGWKCGDTGAYIPIINGSGNTPIFCDDLKDPISCQNAHLTFPSQVSCIGAFSQGASCVWDGTRCGTKYTLTSFTGATDTCTEFFNLDSTQCIEGLRDVTIDATSTTAGAQPLCSAFTGACVPRADTLVCGRPAFELPFFGFWQLVIGLVGIVVMGIVRKVVTLK